MQCTLQDPTWCKIQENADPRQLESIDKILKECGWVSFNKLEDKRRGNCKLPSLNATILFFAFTFTSLSLSFFLLFCFVLFPQGEILPSSSTEPAVACSVLRSNRKGKVCLSTGWAQPDILWGRWRSYQIVNLLMRTAVSNSPVNIYVCKLCDPYYSYLSFKTELLTASILTMGKTQSTTD